MEKLKPMLWSVMKGYTKEQLVKDIVAGIIVAIIALPLSIALALASGVTPERGIYTGNYSRICYFISWRKPCADCGTDSRICDNCCRYSRGKWYRRTGTGNGDGRYYSDHYGCLSNGKPDQIYSIYDHDRFTAGIAVTIFIGQIKDFLGLTVVSEEPLIETMDKLVGIFVLSAP